MPTIGNGGCALAAAAAEIVPRLVPTSQMGWPNPESFCTTARRSATCSSVERNRASRSLRSLGLPTTATLKPASAK